MGRADSGMAAEAGDAALEDHTARFMRTDLRTDARAVVIARTVLVSVTRRLPRGFAAALSLPRASSTSRRSPRRCVR